VYPSETPSFEDSYHHKFQGTDRAVNMIYNMVVSYDGSPATTQAVYNDAELSEYGSHEAFARNTIKGVRESMFGIIAGLGSVPDTAATLRVWQTPDEQWAGVPNREGDPILEVTL
jgi:hypothetical protein